MGMRKFWSMALPFSKVAYTVKCVKDLLTIKSYRTRILSVRNRANVIRRINIYFSAL